MLKKGPLNVLACYVAWGILPLFWRYLKCVASLGVLGYRILFSVLFSVCFLTAVRRWDAVAAVLRDRREMKWLAAAAAAVTVNWGGFIWAVNGGHVLDSSLAYYMYPILSILIGAVFCGEKLRPLQWAAVGLMAAGIAVTAARYGQVPWLAFAIGGSFVLYGVFKLARVLWYELHGQGAVGQLHGAQWLLLPAAGVVTALPLLFFSRGIRETPYALAGLLMLVNPTLQLLVGVFYLEEAFTATHAVLFAFIWGGLALYLAGSLLQSREKA